MEKHILKENCWYLVQAAGEQKPEPQVEEDITEVRWVAPSDFGLYVNNSMPSILDVWREASLIN